MSLIQKILNRSGYLNKTQVKQMYARAYAAAAQNRLTNDWLTTSGHADKDVRWDMASVRARARNFEKNNAYARKYLNLLSINVVGPDGFILQNKAKEADGKTFDKMANNIIENAFYDWALNCCSIDGRYSLRQFSDVAIRTAARDGETFIREITDPGVNKYGYTLQLIESDYLDEKKNETLKNKNVIRMGVEMNLNRKPVRYHFTKANPEHELYVTQVAGGDTLPFDAEEIIHLYDPERANQTRGVSWMAPSMVSLNMLAGYVESALVNARVSASKMGFFKDMPGAAPQPFTGDAKDTLGNAIMDAEPGEFRDIGNKDFVPFDPKYPSDQHDAFVKSMLREIASGWCISYNTLANDLEGVNYSSIRAGLLDEREFYKRVQSWFIEKFLNRIFTHWLENALMMGAIKDTFTQPLPYRKLEKFNQPTWFGRRWGWVDPLKDVQAHKEAVEFGLRTRSQVMAETGNDIYEVFEQLALEKELAKQYGLTFSSGSKETKQVNDDDDESTKPAKNKTGE